MEDPSIISIEEAPLRAIADEYVPKKPVLSASAKAYIPMDIRLAFHNFVKVLEDLHEWKVNTVHIQKMYSLLKVFAPVLTKKMEYTIYDQVSLIQFEWHKVCSCNLYGYPNREMYLMHMTLLMKELYGFLVKVNDAVF